MVFNCKCGACSIYLAKKGSTMVGAYCMDCGAWVKWVSKKDLANLEKQGFRVQPEGYVSPTVKIKQEQLARDRELLAQVNNNSSNTESTKPQTVEKVEISLSCKKCGEQTLEDVYVRKTSNTHTGVYCKCCNSWVKWLSKKEIGYLTSLGVDMDTPVELESQPVDKSKSKPSTESLVNEVHVTYNDYDDEDEYEEEYDDDDYDEEEYDNTEEYMEGTNKISAITSEESKGCDFCLNGGQLTPLSDSKVSLTYFSGVLSIVNESGTELLGSYKLPICPCCGRKLNKN